MYRIQFIFIFIAGASASRDLLFSSQLRVVAWEESFVVAFIVAIVVAIRVRLVRNPERSAGLEGQLLLATFCSVEIIQSGSLFTFCAGFFVGLFRSLFIGLLGGGLLPLLLR